MVVDEELKEKQNMMRELKRIKLSFLLQGDKINLKSASQRRRLDLGI